jgi:hypothetical protein
MDGEIDYSKYTRADLDEAFGRIDKLRFPKNYANLLEESARRPLTDVAQYGVSTAFQPRNGVRVAAALLFAGGLVGTCIFVTVEVSALRNHWPLVFVALPGIGLFVWSTIVGLRLWRGVPGSAKWAKVLFMLQIPVMSVSGSNYEFFTGLAARLLHGPGGTKIEFRIGASLSTEFATDSTRFVVGVNLVAICAFLYLLTRHSAPNSSSDSLV